MMLQTAQMNRDPKKNKKPYSIDDFCLYGSSQDNKIPEARYGSAAMALIKRNEFPSWALFIFNDLKKNAYKANAPELLAYWCDDVIVLAPELSKEGLKGMIIAKLSASRTNRVLRSESGHEVRVIIPPITSSVYAEEDIILDVLSASR